MSGLAELHQRFQNVELWQTYSSPLSQFFCGDTQACTCSPNLESGQHPLDMPCD